jgi:hypothetical protein
MGGRLFILTQQTSRGCLEIGTWTWGGAASSSLAELTTTSFPPFFLFALTNILKWNPVITRNKMRKARGSSRISHPTPPKKYSNWLFSPTCEWCAQNVMRANHNTACLIFVMIGGEWGSGIISRHVFGIVIQLMGVMGK